MKAWKKELLINVYALVLYSVLVFDAIARAGPIINTPAFLFVMFIMGISIGTWVLGIIMSILRRND
jgi:hypothetical protein